MRKILILFLLTGSLAQAQQIQWPKHHKATIILTYDDGLRSQLDTAMPQLEKAKLTGTFFLTSDIDSLSISRWRALAKKGFELGNHTVFHPCSAGEDNPVPSEPYTAYQIIREIEVMDRFLYAVDGKTHRTYAYPCGETFVGGKDYVDTLRKYNLVRYARAGGDSSAIVTNFKQLDPLRVPAYGLDGGESGKQLIAFVKAVVRSGGMGIIMLHGVGGDYITVSGEAHQELINFLKAHRKEIWVATFQQGLDYVNNRIPLKAQKH